ncbi:MAG: FAD-dependent oxidoreductase [Marinagarivorans sp.]|nr:FAD-dependent oxidoreductase [Marinagarivorans sp.]
MTQKKLIIVGNGMAAGRMVDELRARDAERFAITIIGDEIHGSYNRIMLSPVLSGETTAHSIVQKTAEWYANNNITFLGGVRVTGIDQHAQTITCDNGNQLDYDELIIATGSRPARIPAKNQALAGVMAFRTLNDVDTILQRSQTAQHAIVVGGGLLGLEAAYGMAVRGIKVILIHRSGWLLNRQLDKASGKMLEKVMASKGVEFRLGVEIDTFLGEGHVTGARLNSGEVLPCQIAIIATGITPNAELGLEAGLEGNRGIKVDDYLTTSHPNISAIGECTEHNGQTFGLVEPIWQHCISLADRLCLNLQTAYQNTPVATKLKVSGVQVFSAGEWMTAEHHREFVYSDPARHIYRKLILDNNRLVGIVFFGDVRDGQYFFELMEYGVDVINAMPQLLMGRAFCAQLPEIQLQPDEVAA